MKKNQIQTLFLIFICLLLISCEMKDNKEDLIKKSKTEILNTEREFAKMAKEQGIQKAFLKYASDKAVLMRRNKLIIGKPAIEEHFKNQTLKDIHLEWEPDFVDVSSSGDLGYTYGKYIFEATDLDGKIVKNNGVFHTVWKKEKDGKWRYVWD